MVWWFCCDIMEEELNYVTVNFIKRDASKQQKQQALEQVYDEVKTESQRCDTQQAATEQEYEQPTHRPLLLIVCSVCLGIICVILISVIAVLSVHFQTVMSEQFTVNGNLTEQNNLLRAENMLYQNVTGELTSERDRLNWTMGVILEFSDFPVRSYCPQKVCQPCLDGWKLFQSKCYLFANQHYSSGWNFWAQSRAFCRGHNAHLAVIDSLEEQEFISNHSKEYHDAKHGYWIGLSKETGTNKWTWVDGSNTTVTYWVAEQSSYGSCVLLLPKAPPRANWKKTYCDMYNRWICEAKSLIMPEEGASLP
ncbi:LOW QUALITY PROTEIN: C-type lectin domain family 4 member C-like [Neosynchiropus ocellatus]